MSNMINVRIPAGAVIQMTAEQLREYENRSFAAQAGPEIVARVQANGQPEPKVQPEPEPEAQPEPQPKPEPEPEAQPEPQPKPKPESAPEPEPEKKVSAQDVDREEVIEWYARQGITVKRLGKRLIADYLAQREKEATRDVQATEPSSNGYELPREPEVQPEVQPEPEAEAPESGGTNLQDVVSQLLVSGKTTAVKLGAALGKYAENGNLETVAPENYGAFVGELLA